MSRRDRASKNGLFQLLRRTCAKAVRTITAVIRNTSISSALPTVDNRSERRIMRNLPDQSGIGVFVGAGSGWLRLRHYASARTRQAGDGAHAPRSWK